MDALNLALNKFIEMRPLPEGFKIEASKTQLVASKMFIGGLHCDISKQALFEYLSQFGEIEDFIIKTHPDTGLSRGFGFVLFKDNATIEKVLQVKEHRVNGRKIDLKKAKVLESKFGPRKVFVGGLNPRLSEENIRQYFGIFGVIENIEFPVCPGTNERRAFCFITYTAETAVRKVLEARYHFIGSGRCEVKIARQNEYPKLPPKRREAPFTGLGNLWGEKEFPANSNAYTVNQNVSEAFGDCGRLPTVLIPALFSACDEDSRFSDRMYGSFYNDYSNQTNFNRYSGQFFLGCNCETHEIETSFTNYNVHIKEETAFDGGCQGIYKLF